MKEQRYKHIFDFFDDNGRYIGGAEPVTDSIEKPTLDYHFLMPAFVAYLGWCYEDDEVYCGCCFNDNVERDTETLQLKPIMVENGVDGDSLRLRQAKVTKHKGSPTYEEDCEFRGVEPCEKYLRLKKEKEKRFEEEWNKVLNNKEYFREKYYRGDKL